jgi:hypothetical protein
MAVPSQAPRAVARPATGFGGREQEGRFGARWLEESSGTLALQVAGRKRPRELVLTISSFAQPRRVRVALDGRILRVFEAIPAIYRTKAVRLGALEPGRHRVEIHTSPGPQSILATTGLPDPRSVSIRLREPIIVRVFRGG